MLFRSPALQFASRHYFHLEFMTWWAIGVLAEGIFQRPAQVRWRNAIAVAVAAAGAVGVLFALRVYQGRTATALFSEYIAARKIDIPVTPPGSSFVSVRGPSLPYDVRLLEVDVRATQCGPAPTVAFEYDKRQPATDYSKVVVLQSDRKSTRLNSSH